mmetsp:Transcript_141571/g.394591  ORF Transcript_141571/g.394591 Transcript_141571/m.394591 type:complete len:216 (-) Transcript_141571:450-1097(-)
MAPVIEEQGVARNRLYTEVLKVLQVSAWHPEAGLPPPHAAVEVHQDRQQGAPRGVRRHAPRRVQVALLVPVVQMRHKALPGLVAVDAPPAVESVQGAAKAALRQEGPDPHKQCRAQRLRGQPHASWSSKLAEAAPEVGTNITAECGRVRREAHGIGHGRYLGALLGRENVPQDKGPRDTVDPLLLQRADGRPVKEKRALRLGEDRHLPSTNVCMF